MTKSERIKYFIDYYGKELSFDATKKSFEEIQKDLRKHQVKKSDQ